LFNLKDRLQKKAKNNKLKNSYKKSTKNMMKKNKMKKNLKINMMKFLKEKSDQLKNTLEIMIILEIERIPKKNGLI
jgi:hypothetical protein